MQNKYTEFRPFFLVVNMGFSPLFINKTGSFQRFCIGSI